MQCSKLHRTHLVSAGVHGYLSWALAASPCLHLSQDPQQQATEAGTETGTETETGPGSGPEMGSLTGFGFLFQDQALLSSGRLLGHQYLQHSCNVSYC